LGCGQPARGYPFAWSVLSYLPGDTVAAVGDPQDTRLAGDLAHWLCALRAVPAQDGPAPGRHNFYRGGDLRIYDQEVRHCLAQLGAAVDRARVLRIWDKACQSAWTQDPVWPTHGRVRAGGLRGRLVCR